MASAWYTRKRRDGDYRYTVDMLEGQLGVACAPWTLNGQFTNALLVCNGYLLENHDGTHGCRDAIGQKRRIIASDIFRWRIAMQPMQPIAHHVHAVHVRELSEGAP